MTANELADKCNRLQGEIICGFLADCATMLRQQQAEIEQLKTLIISMSPNANLIYTRSEND